MFACLLHECTHAAVVLPATQQVDPLAFDALEECIAKGGYALCEDVPSGDANGFLIQPLGGIAVDMAGPARYDSECCSNPAVGILKSTLITSPVLNNYDYDCVMCFLNASIYFIFWTRAAIICEVAFQGHFCVGMTMLLTP